MTSPLETMATATPGTCHALRVSRTRASTAAASTSAAVATGIGINSRNAPMSQRSMEALLEAACGLASDAKPQAACCSLGERFGEHLALGLGHCPLAGHLALLDL